MHIKRGNFGLHAPKFVFDLVYQRDGPDRAACFTQRFQLLCNIRHMPRSDTAAGPFEGVGRPAQKSGIIAIHGFSQDADALGALAQKRRKYLANQRGFRRISQCAQICNSFGTQCGRNIGGR